MSKPNDNITTNEKVSWIKGRYSSLTNKPKSLGQNKFSDRRTLKAFHDDDEIPALIVTYIWSLLPSSFSLTDYSRIRTIAFFQENSQRGKQWSSVAYEVFFTSAISTIHLRRPSVRLFFSSRYRKHNISQVTCGFWNADTGLPGADSIVLSPFARVIFESRFQKDDTDSRRRISCNLRLTEATGVAVVAEKLPFWRLVNG